MRGQTSDVLWSLVATGLLSVLLLALGWWASSHILRIIEERARPLVFTIAQDGNAQATRTVTRVVTVTESVGSAVKTVTTTLVLNSTVTKCGRITVVITRPITEVPFTLIVGS